MTGPHWLGFIGGKLNLSRVDAALLGKEVGENPPADGEEPESDDNVLVISSNFREWHDEEEAKRSLAKEPKKFQHVDDFIDDPFADKYARWILLHFRQPAHGLAFEEFIKDRRLFCTYERERFRVTMASRFGWIGLRRDFSLDAGYDATAHPNEVTGWGAEP